MEEASGGVCGGLEAVTSSLKLYNPSLSGEGQTVSLDEDAFHMNVAIDLIENDDLLVENEFMDALNEIDGLVVYPCNMCEKICKSKGGLTKHKNSKHVDDNASTSEGSNAPLDKDTMNSIVNTIKQNIVEENLYGDKIEASIKNITATEALFKEVEPLYLKFCKNKNQDKLLKSFYGLMPKSTTLFNLVDSRITNLVMIHIPDHLVSFHNLNERRNASVTTTVNASEECEKIEACEMGPLSYIAGYVVKRLTNSSKKKTESENTELRRLLMSLQSEQENNSFIQARNRGGLVNPSEDLLGILQEAEINFRREVSKSKEILRNIPVDVICYKTISTPIVKSLWDNIVVSSGVNSSGDTQKICLENIVRLFLRVRSFSYAKDYITQYKIREKQGKSKALRKDLKKSK